MPADSSIREQSYSRCDRLQRGALSLDMYPLSFTLLLPGKEDAYRTLLGSVLTIFSVILILAYGGYQMI